MSIPKKKVQFFEEKLIDFFIKSGREELPWRKKGITAYEVWVSEIMLQQTQVSRVVGYYERFLKRFPTVEKLAEVGWEEFLPYYQGLGYYARGRNMLKTAQALLTWHGGVFPHTKKELTALPGIGDYTAGAILSFAYNQKILAWDTNLKRVIGRFFLGSKNAAIDSDFFETHFRSSRKKLNAALMDFGSSLCTGRPKCNSCPLVKQCVYYREGGKQEIKVTKKQEAFPLNEADRAMVTLHERHQRYFSSNQRKYQPFALPQGYISRGAIKDWFLREYGLTVAVRPPHDRQLIKKRKTLLINAQILQGKHQFSVFSKQALKEYTRGKPLSSKV